MLFDDDNDEKDGSVLTILKKKEEEKKTLSSPGWAKRNTQTLFLLRKCHGHNKK